ncbi:plasmid mobilization relaxosome protein MobC [Enterococcus wangshanyuanii]|uniref:Mobilization protein n=1 Tax=Enterococcus wangshanyuanii TaxID=2005703 RepID=A0ABQ1PTV4_9ENTE|nr:plasmid mobilization relaxosome protein MobC [Enterococcus wangshanyuanii]GGD03478.1 mobilization protein [Enterococcus wangshanyuanii]
MENKNKLRRPIQRIIRFSKEENRLINKKVEESFFPNFQNFALHMLIQGEVRHIDYSELKQLTMEIHKIGININQVTRLANQFNEISSTDIQQLKNELTALTETVQSNLATLIKLKERT